jgi:hypothetical protein
MEPPEELAHFLLSQQPVEVAVTCRALQMVHAVLLTQH